MEQAFGHRRGHKHAYWYAMLVLAIACEKPLEKESSLAGLAVDPSTRVLMLSNPVGVPAIVALGGSASKIVTGTVRLPAKAFARQSNALAGTLLEWDGFRVHLRKTDIK